MRVKNPIILGIVYVCVHAHEHICLSRDKIRLLLNKEVHSHISLDSCIKIKYLFGIIFTRYSKHFFKNVPEECVFLPTFQTVLVCGAHVSLKVKCFNSAVSRN